MPTQSPCLWEAPRNVCAPWLGRSGVGGRHQHPSTPAPLQSALRLGQAALTWASDPQGGDSVGWLWLAGMHS